MPEFSGSPPDDRFTFKGDLSQTPLPEVLFTVWRYRVPGAIDCQRGDLCKTLFVDDGRIVFSTSTDLDDSLGARLLRAGRISHGQYEESVLRLADGGGRRQGRILVEMKAIEPKDLFVEVRDQVREIVWSLFGWQEGEFVFTPGRERHREFIKLDFPILDAIAEGVCSVPDRKILASRLGSKSSVYHRDESAPVPETALSPRLREILHQVDGKRPLIDLVSLPLGTPAENAAAIYTLLTFRMIRQRPSSPVKVTVRTG